VHEVRYTDQNLGDTLVSFDGRNVEVYTPLASAPGRFHIHMLVVEVHPPDRKGRTSVDLAPSRAGQGGFRLVVAETDWPTVAPLINEIQAALGG
jgi:hypothetical protein